ncbi:VanW family protein [Intestinibacter bartlettii]|uniref:VanW family protein n=1 Tax=Intestinibacter bartlettii TaxID=261299 RepID=A0ABS6DW53_9FIRM|nr:VanW family protein [Intestinibacter bartlettii]MBU5336039.1 VanW family protein [Intestinibacter bartlettii]
MKKDKLLVMLVIIFMIVSNNVVYAFDLEGKIYKNVYVENINLSNLTKEEAMKKINCYIDEYRYFNLVYKNKKILIDKQTFNLDYNVEQLVEKAYNIGRDKDMITNMKTKLSLKKGDREIIPFAICYDISKVDELIENLNSEFYLSPVSATAKVVDDNIIITEDSYGQAVDKEQLKNIIVSKLENLDTKESEIPIKVLNPKYTYNQLSKINTLLGSYETYFNPKNTNRVTNITVASKSTSNVLIGTNEKFSFNNELSNKNAYSQFKNAPIILNGKPDQGVGGGICQVSTTIYNAALYAGMDIMQITNHSIPSSYIKKGRDATVSEGYIDFAFKNKYDTPILIYNEIYSNKIVSKIYGSNTDKSNIEIDTEVVKTIENKKIYKNDSKLKKGTKVVEQPGRLGYTVNTFRIYKSNDKIIKKELINTSYYPPCDEIILKGTREVQNEVIK